MNALRPISISHFYGGPLLVYEASDAELLSLIPSERLPKARPGCKTKFRESMDGWDANFISTYRLPDGRVRLTISARLVRHFDKAFMRFMATLAAQDAGVA